MSYANQEFHQWESAGALKLLLPQRDEQFAQSDAARNNRIVKPTGRPYLSTFNGGGGTEIVGAARRWNNEPMGIGGIARLYRNPPGHQEVTNPPASTFPQSRPPHSPTPLGAAALSYYDTSVSDGFVGSYALRRGE